MHDQWATELRSDPSIGSRLDTVSANIGKALSLLPPDLETSFRQAMNDTGVGNHPAIVKTMNHLATLLNEGTHVTGGGPSPHGQTPSGVAKPRSAASAMYPNLPSS